MTTTSTRAGRTPEPTSPAHAPAPEASLTPPPKLRRRPALMVGGIAAICLGALLAVWAWTSTTHTEDVLAARVTIHRGDVITAGDLERVRVNGDPALAPVPASAYDSIIGKRAALDIAAGGLVTADATGTQPLPPAGQSVVGISLTAAQLPAVPLLGGDAVRIVATPGQNGTPAKGGAASTPAQVVDTSTDAATGNTIVDVLVPSGQAASLAALAATGNVALVLDSQDSAAPSTTGAGGR